MAPSPPFRQGAARGRNDYPGYAKRSARMRYPADMRAPRSRRSMRWGSRARTSAALSLCGVVAMKCTFARAGFRR